MKTNNIVILALFLIFLLAAVYYLNYGNTINEACYGKNVVVLKYSDCCKGGYKLRSGNDAGKYKCK
jgi:hypothetical protein